jgi:hypothetical protein
MQHIHERLLARLAALGWTVERNAPAGAPAPALPAAHRDFLDRYSLLCRADETAWFLSAADYAGMADSAFAWDEFKRLSLDAALDDEDRQAISTFWDRHLPVLMSVAGDYEFLAIDQSTGAVVHGIEPEFEVVTVVADSWAGFCEAVIAGRVLPALFKQAS